VRGPCSGEALALCVCVRARAPRGCVCVCVCGVFAIYPIPDYWQKRPIKEQKSPAITGIPPDG
jgi:hypothetical protein